MWPLLAQAEPNNLTQIIDNIARTPLSRVVIFIAVCTAIRLAIVPILARTPAHKRTGSYPFLKFLNETFDALVYAGGFVFLVIRPFVLQTFYIPTGSMLDTLQLNDTIIANKFVYRVSEPKAGDIVVFRPPADQIPPDQIGKDYIKRLIGTPGMVVEVRDGVLYRNGKRIDESKYATRDGGRAFFDFKLVKDGDRYVPVSIVQGIPNVDTRITAPTFAVEIDDVAAQERLMSLPPVAIPEGYYLFMGDNRNQSFDGRAWGLTPRRNIIGRSEFIWLPFSRLGSTASNTGIAQP